MTMKEGISKTTITDKREESLITINTRNTKDTGLHPVKSSIRYSMSMEKKV